MRSLKTNRAFAAVTIFTLALGIGANSAIFSVIDGVLLQPLPYPQPERLYRLFFSRVEYPRFPLNPNDFLDFRQRNHVFESIATYTRSDLQLSDPSRPERLAALQVSEDYFRVLGSQPLIGRTFTSKDCVSGDNRSVILSFDLWQRRFHSDPSAIGRKVTLSEQPFTVVGVMPAGLQHVGGDFRSTAHGATVDVWTPFPFWPASQGRGSHYLNCVGRLKANVSVEHATAEMNIIAAQLAREYPDSNLGWHVLVIPLFTDIVGPAQRLLWVLLGAVGFVLLIACVNVANLLLARATSRQREIAVRAALGAGRFRIARQVLTESMVLAFCGAIAGGILAVWGVRILRVLIPPDFPRAQIIHVNLAVFAFTLLIAASAGLLFGLAPAWQSSKTDLNYALRESGRGAGSSRRQVRLRGLLVVGEVALASVLLTGAGLLLRSLLNLLREDPGFRPERVLTATVTLPRAHYHDEKTVANFCDQLTKRIASVPGVLASGAGSDIPWTGYDENMGGFLVEGHAPELTSSAHARYHNATPDYFRALGVPLIRGRFFRESDNTDAPKVLIINQSMARRYWPGEDSVGKRVSFDDHPKETDWFTVVGVVGDVKDTPTAKQAEPAFWWAWPQQPVTLDVILAIRTASDPVALSGAVRAELRAADPNIALADLRTMSDVAGASVSKPRFAFLLVGVFSALALLLAAVGAYGVMAYSVAQRKAEFGLRMALGASPGDVAALVLRKGLQYASAGAGLGLVLALGVSRTLNSMLYGVDGFDPLTFLGVAVFTMATALLASYLPAWRATKADPMVALRYE